MRPSTTDGKVEGALALVRAGKDYGFSERNKGWDFFKKLGFLENN